MTKKERVEAAKAEYIKAQDNLVLTIAAELKGAGEMPLGYMPELVDAGIFITVLPDWEDSSDEDERWMLDRIRYNDEANDFEVHVYSINEEETDEWERLDGINFAEGSSLDVIQNIQFPDGE